ncbi:MAG TPA: NUDIX domain-containing protein [Dissulfurispiraceae bacterium]|nr:NUDIX domain-containing protein [Dissulfurispiraceae bacterium]
MAKESAGLLMYRRKEGQLQVFLVHPGGPFWMKKDQGAWSIPKGLFEPGEDAYAAAKREFQEETGIRASGVLVALAPVRTPSGKIVHAWALEGDCDPDSIRSNTFTIEWPPRSGKMREFPEVDRAAWFAISEARRRIHRGQVALLDELERKV